MAKIAHVLVVPLKAQRGGGTVGTLDACNNVGDHAPDDTFSRRGFASGSSSLSTPVTGGVQRVVRDDLGSLLDSLLRSAAFVP